MPPKLLTGRRRVERDAVICATGYRRNLERLVGHLGVLDVHGIPKVRGEKAAAEGLRFVGFMPRPGALGSIAKETKHAAPANWQRLRLQRRRTAHGAFVSNAGSLLQPPVVPYRHG